MEGLTIVVAGPFQEEIAFIRAAVEEAGCRVHQVRTYREAMIQLCREKVPVILCRAKLPDGSWEDIVSGASSHTRPPRVIVAASEFDDQLYSDVLNLGGFDVLTLSSGASDLGRSIESARRSWCDEVQQEAWRRVAPIGIF